MFYFTAINLWVFVFYNFLDWIAPIFLWTLGIVVATIPLFQPNISSHFKGMGFDEPLLKW